MPLSMLDGFPITLKTAFIPKKMEKKSRSTEQTLICPIQGLDEEFPDSVFVLRERNKNTYGCYCHRGVHGLACFSNPARACEFAMLLKTASIECLKVTFDEAREIAKQRPLPVVAVMLLDDLENPLIHYVR